MSPNALLYKPEEAAIILGIGRSKVFEFMADGRLPSVKIGRSRRISRQACEDFVARLVESQVTAACDQHAVEVAPREVA